jgi:hypothetical protein
VAAGEQALFVIADHRSRANASHDAEHSMAVGSTRDEIADQHQPIAGSERSAAQELFELRRAAMHVTDDQGPAHAANLNFGNCFANPDFAPRPVGISVRAGSERFPSLAAADAWHDAVPATFSRETAS